MNSPTSNSNRAANAVRWLASSTLLAGLLLLSTLAAAAEGQAAPAPADAATPAKNAAAPAPAKSVRPPTAAEHEKWRRTIMKTPKPKRGCFTATYPDKQWREVPCITPPNKLYPPRNMTHPLQVGNGPDFSAVVSGDITEAEGSFDSVSGVTSECAVACPNGVCPANPTCSPGALQQYSLQLNTRPFTTQTCSASPDPACRGWEQFVYSSGGGGFIQYWLEFYGPAGTQCPQPRGASCVQGSVSSDGWCPFQFSPPTSEVYCVVNAAQGAPAPSRVISFLPQMKVAGAAAGVNGAANDAITVTIAGQPYSAPGNNYFPDLGNQWQEAEFNVFGDGGGDQAVFNSGSTLAVRTAVTSGTTAGPACDLRSFTGESSNLTLVNSAPAAVTGSMPALLFSESNPASAGAAATCADATSVGDTHLSTFNGLLYDFQASGDFILAEVEPRLLVQTRQVSGAPTWPSAAVNHAVATRMGNTRIAVCLAPARLIIDGQVTKLGEGETLSRPDGVAVYRIGNAYTAMNAAGDTVRAEINPTWINVSVGLGHWPEKVRGLIANADGDVSAIQARDGAVLRNPFPFAELYHHYADSWRVSREESLLAACDERYVEPGIPQKLFYATDLDAQAARHARAVCAAAGVKVKSLLEACTLDVAVIGDDAAAKVFVGARVPKAVGKPRGGDHGHHDRDHDEEGDRR